MECFSQNLFYRRCCDYNRKKVKSQGEKEIMEKTSLFLDFITSENLKKIKLNPTREPYNDLLKGMIFYEIKAKVNYDKNRYDFNILREYVVVENKQGKVTTICIHHCEDYVISKRTDWKKKIAKQFRNFKTPAELEKLYHLPPIACFVRSFDSKAIIGDRPPFEELDFSMYFFKKEKNNK